MIANDRFGTIRVKEVGGRWAVCDANDVALYEYTTARAARYKANRGRAWGQNEGESALRWSRPAVIDTAVLRRDAVGDLAQMRDERIQLMSLVAQTYRHLTNNLDRELKQAVGISAVFFDVLIHVETARGSRLTMSRLSSQVALTTGGLTRRIDRMVDAGLVQRQNFSNDRRSFEIVLTEAGREVLMRAVATHIESVDRHLVAPFKACDRASFATALRKVVGQETRDNDVLYIR